MSKFYQRFCVCFALYLCVQASTHAQSIITVIDRTSQLPIADVHIIEQWNHPETGKKNNFIGTTNELGQYELHDEFIKNKGELILTHDAYQTIQLSAFNIINLNYLINLSPSSLRIEEVVISANKFEEPKKDVPRQIETIRKGDIEFSNQQHTADLLQNSGQVFVQKSQMGGGSPVMRGFEANKTLIVIDGIRMNNAIYRGGHLQNILRIDQHMIQQAELFFGPGSVVYGSDALGGVMHFTTRSPLVSKGTKTAIHNNAFVRYGTVNNEVSSHYDVSIGWQKWAFLTSISASSFGDLTQGKNRNNSMGSLGLRDSTQSRINGKDITVANTDETLQAPTAYKQIDIMQKVLFAPSPKMEHLLNLQFSNTTDVPRYDRLTEKNNTTFKSAEWYYGPETRLLAAYHLNLKRSTFLYDEAKVITAYQYIEESRHNRNFGSNFINNRNEYVHVLSVNADFIKKMHKQEIRYGAELTRNTVRSNANRENINNASISSISTRYPDGGSDMSTAAAYISHSVELNKFFILTEGLRYNWVKLHARFNDKSYYSFLPDNLQQQNKSVNGQVGLVYLPGGNWKLNTAFSTGFRAPNIDDVGKIFDSQSGELAIIPNPNLKPENTYNIDFGIGKIIAQKIKIDINTYYSFVRQLITNQHTTVNGNDSILYNGQQTYIMQLQNKQKAFIYGTSATLSADITKNISLVNTLNYTFGRIETDSSYYPLDHIPPLFGRSAIHVMVKNIHFEFFVLYNGWKHIKDYNLLGEDNQQYATAGGTPAWYTLNIRMSYSYLINKTNRLQFQLGCENILDRNYRNFASGISAPGRNIYTTIRFTF
jgi:hemoglobin/transferrin/lactoferrin receptor protein